MRERQCKLFHSSSVRTGLRSNSEKHLLGFLPKSIFLMVRITSRMIDLMTIKPRRIDLTAL